MLSDGGGCIMPKPKPYKSKDWLRMQHYTKKKSVDQIAKECGVTTMTIRRQFESFGMRIQS